MMVTSMDQEVPAQPVARWRHVWLLWALAIALGLGAGVSVSRVDRGVQPAPLKLEVARPAADLVIRWNPRSPAAAGASHAVISLTGESGTVQLVCDRACLDRGSIAYPWRDGSADIGMQFTASSGEVTEERTRYVMPAAADTTHGDQPAM